MVSRIPPKSKQKSYLIRLTATPDKLKRDPDRRLRGLLKVALRGFGLRCESARPIGGDDAER